MAINEIPIDRIAGKFQLLKMINYGSFGQIYRGINMTNNELIAVKLESVSAKAMLLYECKMYKNMLGTPGFSQIYYFGIQNEHNVLVMDLLGPSLEDLFQMCQKEFSPKTTLMVTEQILQRLEMLHFKTFLHRDQKPDNYCIGRGRRKNLIYMIDFGLVKRYWINGTHIQYRDGRGLVGTIRYSSLNTHNGLEYSRRDDLESCGYVLLRFIRGSLPWQGIKVSKTEKYSKIFFKKQEVTLEELCRGLPPFFLEFMVYARNLRFDQDPDYPYLKRILTESLVRSKIELDYCYDWNLRGIATDEIEITSRKLRKKLEHQQTSGSEESTKVALGDDFKY